MTQVLQARNQLISYLTLRRATGVIGILLPVVLISGNQLFFSGPLPLSVSDYYYTHMRNVLVGALIVLGVFMLSYVGYDNWDRWITNGAGLFLIGVAFFPTTSGVLGDIHYGVAGIAFILLSVMAVRFTRTAPGIPPTPQKHARNRVYLICAIIMLGSQAVLGVLHLTFSSLMDNNPIDFVGESLAVMAFGVSWFVKGETLLKDT